MSKKEFIKEVIRDTGKGVKGYFKSRLIIMAFTFLILIIGFDIIEAPLPVLMAILIAIVDILPLIGAGIIMIPWAIISYFVIDKDLGIGLAVVYVVLTVIKQIMEPKILGDQIGLRPIYTFLATVLGSIIFGPLGLILGPIIAVIINSVIKIRKKYK